MFINKIAKFAPVWTTVIKIRVIFVHKSLTEHVLYTTCHKVIASATAFQLLQKFKI